MVDRNEVDVVKLEPSVLGGFTVQLIGFDGRTLFFQRHQTYEQACEALKLFRIAPPPARKVA